MISLKNLNLRSCFRFINGALTILAVLIVIEGIHMFRSTRAGSEVVHGFQRESVPSQQLLQELKQTSLQFEIANLGYIFGQTEDVKAIKEAEAIELSESAQETIDNLESITSTPALSGHIGNIRTAFSAYATKSDEIRTLLKKDLFFEAVELWDKDIPVLNVNLRGAVQQGETAVSKIYNDSVQSTTDSFESLASRISLFSIVNVALALLIAIFSGFASRKTKGILNRSLQALSGSADRINHTSNELVGSAQRSAEASVNEANVLASTRESMLQQASMTQTTASNSRSADGITGDCFKKFESTRDTILELDQSMRQISDSGAETQKIIQTINEIAFQTNLLALNAAVEAARAGDAGAGFAIVADEVRNLAIRSADAANSSSELIEKSAQNIASGTQIVRQACDSFDEVSGMMKSVSNHIRDIADETDKQAASIQEMTASISELSASTENNKRFANETADSCRGLQEQSEKLDGVVGELLHLAGNANGPVSVAKPKSTQQPAPPVNDFNLSRSQDSFAKTEARAGAVDELWN